MSLVREPDNSLIPSDSSLSPLQYNGQGTACICLTVKCRHDLSFFYYVHLTKFHRIHMEFSASSLTCSQWQKVPVFSLSTISSRRHNIRINHVVNKIGMPLLSVKRNRFMPGQSDCCRSMFSIGTCVRNGVQINSTDSSIFHSSSFTCISISCAEKAVIHSSRVKIILLGFFVIRSHYAGWALGRCLFVPNLLRYRSLR